VKSRILLVSPPESYRIQPYIRAAHSLGIDINLASQGEWAVSTPQSAGINVPLHDQEAALDILLDLTSRQSYDAVIGTDDSVIALSGGQIQ